MTCSANYLKDSSNKCVKIDKTTTCPDNTVLVNTKDDLYEC